MLHTRSAVNVYTTNVVSTHISKQMRGLAEQRSSWPHNHQVKKAPHDLHSCCGLPFSHAFPLVLPGGDVYVSVFVSRLVVCFLTSLPKRTFIPWLFLRLYLQVSPVWTLVDRRPTSFESFRNVSRFVFVFARRRSTGIPKCLNFRCHQNKSKNNWCTRRIV